MPLRTESALPLTVSAGTVRRRVPDRDALHKMSAVGSNAPLLGRSSAEKTKGQCRTVDELEDSQERGVSGLWNALLSPCGENSGPKP